MKALAQKQSNYSHVNNGLGKVETRLLEMWIHWDSIQKSVEGKLLSEKDTMTYQDVYFQKDKCKKILKEKLRIEKAFRAVTHEDIHKFIVR